MVVGIGQAHPHRTSLRPAAADALECRRVGHRIEACLRASDIIAASR